MADLKISQLPAWTPVDTDLIPFVNLQGTPVTQKATRADLKGDKWDTWDAATVDAWTTTTTAPWTNATVTNSGTTSAAVFDFEIPRGDVWADWIAATATAWTTTTLPAWSSATVTNVWTTSAAVFDFWIPKGVDWSGNVSSSANIVDGNVVVWDWWGKNIKDSWLTLSGTNTWDQDLSGLLDKATYDPQTIGWDAFLRSNHNWVFAPDKITSVTDPATDTAVTTAIVDANDWIVITTTATSNNQTIWNPTNTTWSKSFTILNNPLSTDSIKVNDVVIQIWEFVEFKWNGSSWNANITDSLSSGMISTWVIYGIEESGTLGGTTFDLSIWEAVFVDDFTDEWKPKVTHLMFSEQTWIAITGILTSPITYILIDSSWNIIQQPTWPTPSQRRSLATVWVIVHPTGVVAGFIEGRIPPVNQLANQIQDLALAIGAINLSWNLFWPNGANLQIDKTLGTIFANGQNRANNPSDPSTLTLSSLTAAPFTYTWRDWSWGFNVALATQLNPTRSDDWTGWVTQPNNVVNGNNWSVHRIYVSPNNQVAIHYGQEEYGTYNQAIERFPAEPFQVNPALEWAVLRAYVVARGWGTDGEDTGDIVFIESAKFWGVGWWSVWGWDLQSAYDLSSLPQIITELTKWAFTVRSGSWDDTDAIYQGQNNIWTTTFQVLWNWNIKSAFTPVANDDVTRKDYVDALDGTTIELIDWGWVTVTGAISDLASTKADKNWDTLTNTSVNWVVLTNAWPVTDFLRANGTYWPAWGWGWVSDIVAVHWSWANQSIPNVTFVKVALNTEEIDTGNNFDTTTNEYTAPSDWIYYVSWTLTYASFPADQIFGIQLRKNTNQTTQITNWMWVAWAASVSSAILMDLVAWDKISMYTLQFSWSTQDIFTSQKSTHLNIYKIS